jgi:hypothetical protein
MSSIPEEPLTAERLFTRHFWPLYPDDAQRDLAAARVTDANPAQNPHLLASVDAIAATFVALAPSLFDGADLALDHSDASVHRLAAAITRARRDAWADAKGPDGASLLVHAVVHGTMYVGRCAVLQHAGVWQLRRPLWESLVRLRSPAGEADLALFQWWLKCLSDAEIDRHTLADRYRMHVEQPRLAATELAPIAAVQRESRPIPRLVKVRYDTLFKHLKAHVPELRDLGEHFPSPERLTELGFAHLDFAWLGEGRILLVHGPTASGVHLFWLDHAGFRQAAFFPSDDPPSREPQRYTLTQQGETLRVSVRWQGQLHEHEMLWWGA